MSEENGNPHAFVIEPEPKLRFELGEDEVIEDLVYNFVEVIDRGKEQSQKPDGSYDITRWDDFAIILREYFKLAKLPTRWQAKQIWDVINTAINNCEDSLKKKLDDLPDLPIGVAAASGGSEQTKES